MACTASQLIKLSIVVNCDATPMEIGASEPQATARLDCYGSNDDYKDGDAGGHCCVYLNITERR